jgi:hypothetical protein
VILQAHFNLISCFILFNYLLHFILQKLVSLLNASHIASSTEVVIAPPALHLSAFASKLRKDIHVAAQVRLGKFLHPKGGRR